MKRAPHPDSRRLRSSGSRSTALALAVSLACASSTYAEISFRSQSSEAARFESAGASRVIERVRAGSTGVMFQIFVQVGDNVQKGQVLGHTELEATKLQLDLTRQALEDRSNLEAMEGQAAAWTVTREETEDAVHRRKVEKSRLNWALGMEKMFRGTYNAQLGLKKTQQIQHDYWKDQYEKRFFRSPVDGVVSEVLVEVGKPINYATHVFTIKNDDTYVVPVTVPASLAHSTAPQDSLAVRASDGKTVSRGLVDSVSDDPGTTGRKIIKLLVQAADFPAASRASLLGMKFDVLLPR